MTYALGYVGGFYVLNVLDDGHIELVKVPTERYEAVNKVNRVDQY